MNHEEIINLKNIFEKRLYQCRIPNKFVMAEMYGEDAFSIKNENSEIDNIDDFNKNELNTVMWSVNRFLNIFRICRIVLNLKDIKEIYNNINTFVNYIKTNPIFISINKDFLLDDLYLKNLKDFSTDIYNQLDLKNYKYEEQNILNNFNSIPTISNSALLNLFNENKKLEEERLLKFKQEQEREKNMHEYYFLNSSR